MSETTAKDETKVIDMKDRLKARLNPADQTPLRPDGSIHDLPMSSPPIVSQPRPMPPPPPMPLRSPVPRGVFTSGELAPRPKTEYAKDLERQAAEPKPRPRLCPVCGGTKRVNELRDKRDVIVGFGPCPECVEM